MGGDIFCANCFSMIPLDTETCPNCKKQIAVLSERDYGRKLVHALRHPLADIRMRAIIALGLRGDAHIARELVACALRHPTDVIEALEIVKSLSIMNPSDAKDTALGELRDKHPAAAVRIAAMAALLRLFDAARSR
jgi:hypothetical protein